MGHCAGKDAEPDGAMSVSRYLSTRFTSLKPPMLPVPNPWRLVRMLNAQQWAFFALSFGAWTWDSFDFFTVSLTVGDLAKDFGKTPADITWGITLVLMFRSVGSIVFGVASDRWGRKWPFIVNNLLFILLELGTAFCQTYSQFLACRAMFGVAMGGLYGNVAATALEDVPEEARGLMSGILQQGYAFGYLLCAAFARGLVDTTSSSWRPLYWFAACPPALFIGVRLLLPETRAFIARKREEAEREEEDEGSAMAMTKTKTTMMAALARHWLLLVYLVLLMAGFNFMSHGSQDLYPTMLGSQLLMSKTDVTITQVVSNLGAMAGGVVVGFASQSAGRRLSILACCLVGGALLYPYGFAGSRAIMAAAFFQQFCVQGAWGVVPVHLMELSPPAYRALVVGTAYQLGNLISSASSTIEARIAERFPLASPASAPRYNYAKVICILMGCVYAYTIVLTFLGPERLGRSFIDGERESPEIQDDSDGRTFEEADCEKSMGGVVYRN